MTEELFLKKEYIIEILNQFKEIRDGSTRYRIAKSDRPNSVSIYIEFYCCGKNKWFKEYILRISDHKSLRFPNSQFLINLKKPLKKVRKILFSKTIANCIYKAHSKHLNKTLNNL